MHCPTLEEVTAATIALLPRGRAWQMNEGGPQPGHEVGFAATGFATPAFATTRKKVSVLWQYWRSFAVVLYFLNQRLCALREEFWCRSIAETRDEWMTEYGLPDECDPFPDLCTKVAALGGTRCEYYAEVAARSGWSIYCTENVLFCGSRAGFARAGRARAGRTMGIAELRVTVIQEQSPALDNAGRNLPPLAGRFRAGRRHSCGPDLSPLICILARIVHAEIQLTLEVSHVA